MSTAKPASVPRQRLGAPLVLHNIHKRFPLGREVAHVLRGAELTMNASQIVALVGESGSGKSTLARTIMRLYTPEEGTMTFDGQDVTRVQGHALREYRKRVQMVFQDPFAALNPTHSIRTILKRSLPPGLWASLPAKHREELLRDALAQVGLTPPDNFLQQFPHELSGGQRQRVALARSLAARPDLVVADEPVSMLDVSLRLGVLNLMLSLNERFGIGYLYITHDLAGARYVSSRIAVMYAGEIVEEGPSDDIVEHGQHPYTQLLIHAAPDPERVADSSREPQAETFTGEPPNLAQEIRGCPFQFRCPHVHDRCYEAIPTFHDVGSDHRVKCHLYDQ